MEEKNYTGIIPEQHTGQPIDISQSVDLPGEAEAKAFYQQVKNKLQRVNQWHETAASFSAEFQLIDEHGQEAHRPAQKGDYFKINIPGPGTVSGEGYDWVQIEDVQETSSAVVESFGFRVRPANDPRNTNEDTAHFYSPESTSSFTVTREGNKVTVAIYDRNTKANADADTLVDKVRDMVVGTMGVIAFSRLQWNSLAEGLLKRGK